MNEEQAPWKRLTADQIERFHFQAMLIVKYLEEQQPTLPVVKKAVMPYQSWGFDEWCKLSEEEKYLFFTCALAGVRRQVMGGADVKSTDL